MSYLNFKLITPEGIQKELSCDSVRLYMRSDSQGRGEGYLGIHPGHESALIALGNGPVRCFMEGKELFHTTLSSGIATIQDNELIVLSGEIACAGHETP